MRPDYLIFLLVLIGAVIVLGAYLLRRSGRISPRAVWLLAAVVAVVGALTMLLPYFGLYGEG
ncbi:MAG TPA: hypothetical protein VNT77_03535 [Allosphingosinicella sp.]|nr:hypothetical protein [Allosphingosinicella sp.]